jgi:hypothetical protein
LVNETSLILPLLLKCLYKANGQKKKAKERLSKYVGICIYLKKKIDIILRKGNVFNEGNTTIPISGAGTVYPSGAPEFTPRFLVGFVLVDL